MNKRFGFELVVGIIGLIAVFYFGDDGMLVFVLLAAHPFIGKKKSDEREAQLFYKIGNITAAGTLLASVGIYYASDIVMNGNLVLDLWLFLLANSFLIIHGASGLIILRRN